MSYTFLIAGNKQTLTGKPVTVETMREFAERLEDAAPSYVRNKLDCPALFGPRKDNSRAKGSVILPRNWLNIDVDGGKPKDQTGKPIKGAESRGISALVLKNLINVLKEYNGFIHPTWSDKPTGRKVRVFLALDKELGKEDWEEAAENFCRMLMNKIPELREKADLTASIDSASWVAAQFMFIPPKEKAARIIYLDGKPITTAELPNPKGHTNEKNLADNSTRAQRKTKGAVFELDSVFGDGSEDPILNRIIDKGLLIREASDRRYDIRCPIGSHDPGSESSTSYFAPGAVNPNGKTYRYGSIYCFHDTCRSQGHRTGDYFRALGIDYEDYKKWIDQHFPVDAYDKFRTGAGEFEVIDGTVYLARWFKDGLLRPAPVFSEIEILGRAREENETNWGRIVRFKNTNGQTRELFLQDKDLTGKGDPVRERLSEEGLKLYTRSGAANALCDFIYHRPEANSAPLYLVTHKTGWHNRAFVLPEGEIIGEPEEPIFYQPESFKSANFETKGTLEDWIGAVAHTAEYAPPLMLALCAGFAAPLMHLLSESHETGGFHFYGSSGMGKTLITKAAASIYGRPSDAGGRIIQWSATANSLEYWAEAHNDTLLCLDEISQADPKTLASCLYSLGNAGGKPRLFLRNSDLGLRRILSWRLLWISTGEVTTTQYISANHGTANAGTEIRSIPIELDMGKTLVTGAAMGAFESLPEEAEENAAAFASVCRKLAEGTDANYGVAGRCWIEFLVKNPQRIKEAEEKWGVEFENELKRQAPDGLGTQQYRQARRFKLCAIAGELAGEAGLTEWTAGEATKNAVRLMLRSFGDNRTETKERKALIHSFLKLAQNLSGFARFGDTNRAKVLGYRNFDIASSDFPEVPTDSETKNGQQKQTEDIHTPEGVQKTEERRLYLLDETFENTIGNFTPIRAAKFLNELGVLIAEYEKSKDGRMKFRAKAQVRTGKNSPKMRLYTLKYDALLALEEG